MIYLDFFHSLTLFLFWYDSIFVINKIKFILLLLIIIIFFINMTLLFFLCYCIVIRNGRVVWKHGQYCWYFCSNVKYLGWPYRLYIKIAKNGNFGEELHSENDFKAVLGTFCSYDHGVRTSEAVQKIASDQIEYWKCYLCNICWIAKIYLCINNSDTSDLS